MALRRQRRTRLGWWGRVEWRGNNADRLRYDGAGGKGGELEIEKTKIGQWEVFTKA